MYIYIIYKRSLFLLLFIFFLESLVDIKVGNYYVIIIKLLKGKESQHGCR